MAHARSMAMDVVAKERPNLTVQPLFGVVAEVRRQFKVSYILGIERLTLMRAVRKGIARAAKDTASRNQSSASGGSAADVVPDTAQALSERPSGTTDTAEERSLKLLAAEVLNEQDLDAGTAAPLAEVTVAGDETSWHPKQLQMVRP